MKRQLIFCVIVALTLFVSQVTLAQDNPINLGARLGLNFGDASFDPDLPSGVTTSMRTGFAFGAYGEIGVAENFFIAGEFLYLQSGLVSKEDAEEATWKVDYFAIPISAKYKFAIENSTIKPYVFAGPTLGFNLSAKVSDGTEVDIKDNIESINFALHFGAGAEFEVTPGTNLFFDASYGLGLSDIYKESEGVTDNQKINSRDIGIKAGVSFKIN
jgi:opacity protein-like surface antigen